MNIVEAMDITVVRVLFVLGIVFVALVSWNLRDKEE